MNRVRLYGIFHILPILLMFTLSSCDKSDPSDFHFDFNAPGSFSSDASVKARQQALLDKYGVHFVSSVSDVFSHFEWTRTNTLEYIAVDEKAQPILLSAFDELEKVLADMPEDVIKSIPSYVILADSIAFDCNLVNYNNTSDTLFTRQTLMSYSSSNFIALGCFGPLFSKVPVAHVRQMWAVAILNYYLNQLSENYYPQEFFDYAVELQGSSAYNANCTGTYFPLDVYPEYNMETYGCFDYIFRSLSTYYGYFMGPNGTPYRLSYDTYMTVNIDLACHLAFALYATDDERDYYMNHPTAKGAFVEKQRLALEYVEKILDWNIKR